MGHRAEQAFLFELGGFWDTEQNKAAQIDMYSLSFGGGGGGGRGAFGIELRAEGSRRGFTKFHNAASTTDSVAESSSSATMSYASGLPHCFSSIRIGDRAVSFEVFAFMDEA